jgi:hypothetical protein
MQRRREDKRHTEFWWETLVKKSHFEDQSQDTATQRPSSVDFVGPQRARHNILMFRILGQKLEWKKRFFKVISLSWIYWLINSIVIQPSYSTAQITYSKIKFKDDHECEIRLETLRKPTKISVRMLDIPKMARTGHHQNIIIEHYLLNMEVLRHKITHSFSLYRNFSLISNLSSLFKWRLISIENPHFVAEKFRPPK